MGRGRRGDEDEEFDEEEEDEGKVGRKRSISQFIDDDDGRRDRKQRRRAGSENLDIEAQSCVIVGGSHGNHDRNGIDSFDSRFGGLRSSSRFLQSPRRLPPRGPPIDFGGWHRGGRGHDSLVNKCIKIKSGPWKGYRGQVIEVTGSLVRVELDSQMKIITVKRHDIADTASVLTPFREPRYGMGSETPMHPSRTPLHPMQTPMRDSGGSAPSPYLPSTPGGQPMTPSSASYLPGTPGGQPMTPGNVGLDIMSPTIGEGEGNWLMPDILVNVLRAGEDSHVGVIREVMMDGSFKVSLESAANKEIITALPTELEVVKPRKSDKIKIMNGSLRGVTGKLIGIDGSDGIVKLDDTYEVKILDMVILAKLATQ